MSAATADSTTLPSTGGTAAAIRPYRRPRRRSSRPSTVLTIGMLAALAYFLLPLFWLVVASTKTNEGLFSSFGLWFDGTRFNLFDNIREVLTYQDGIFLRWLGNTTLYAVVSSGGAALLATAGGYAFAKYDFPGKNAMFVAVLGSIMVPSTALAIPTYLLMSRVGIVNTPWAIILPSLLSPFGIYLMRVYAAGAIPDGLIEAGRIDGAGEFRIFWLLALRQLVPGFVTVLLFTLVATWNNYFLPLIMLNDPDWFPVTVGLAQWNAQASGGGGAQALFSLVVTGSLLSIVPLVAAFLLLQRYWQSGLGVGSVKQ
jgi:multiple sugar transport system permease protein